MKSLKDYFITLPSGARLIVKARLKIEAMEVYERLGHQVTCDAIKLVAGKK